MVKRTVLVFLFPVLVVVFMFPAFLSANDEIRVAVDGEVRDLAQLAGLPANSGSLRREGRIYLPARGVLAAVGINASFTAEGTTFTFRGNAIEIRTGERSFTRDGETVSLEAPMANISDVLMVPTCLLEALGMEVVFTATSNMLVIESEARQNEETPQQTAQTGQAGQTGQMQGQTPGFILFGGGGQQTPQAPTAPQTPVHPGGVIIHTVVAGENLSSIARLRHPHLDHSNNNIHLRAVNQIYNDNPNITNRNRLLIGWNLRIYPFGQSPPAQQETAQAPQTVHTVQPRETLDMIVRLHFPHLNVDNAGVRYRLVRHVARDNDIQNINRIIIGQRLVINPYTGN